MSEDRMAVAESNQRSKQERGTYVIEEQREIVLPGDWMDYFVRRLALLSARQSEKEAEFDVNQSALVQKPPAK